MKKVLLMSAAIAAMVFTSCSKEENGGTGKADTYVSVKISGVIQSRAVEAPGSTAIGTIQLTDGHIFVLDGLGAVTHHEALNVTQATGAGQVLGSPVPSGSRIYIIGNIPSADLTAVSGCADFDAIKAATSLLTTQTNYKTAALANSDGQPAAITLGAGNTASVNVSIKPLISRLELAQVKGGANITAFNVKGVYVDDYYPSFTYGGLFSGTKFSQGQSTNFTGNIGAADAGATAAGTPLVAAPASGNVWAHNLASGGLPRLIIALDGVKYMDGPTEVDLTGTTYYLTVTGYNNLGSTTFQRGKIYRIGAADGITFDEDDLDLTPNPVDVTLTVGVSIEEWVLVTPDAIL